MDTFQQQPPNLWHSCNLTVSMSSKLELWRTVSDWTICKMRYLKTDKYRKCYAWPLVTLFDNVCRIISMLFVVQYRSKIANFITGWVERIDFVAFQNAYVTALSMRVGVSYHGLYTPTEEHMPSEWRMVWFDNWLHYRQHAADIISTDTSAHFTLNKEKRKCIEVRTHTPTE